MMPLNLAPRILSLVSLFQRFSVYGDFWPKAMKGMARHCPWYLEPMMIGIFSALFWAICYQQRRAVTDNLQVLFPEDARCVNALRSLRVFWNFAWSMLDRIHVRDHKPVISWNIHGRENLKRLEATQGAILMTAHMGNYDVAAPVFAHHFDQPIHIVRAPERQQANQEFQRAQLKDQAPEHFKVHYNESGNMLGVELAKAIQEGGVVAIQGDRVLFDVSPVTVPFDELYEWRVPRGPFTLGIVSKVPLYPVFIIREGYRAYRVEAYDPFEIVVEGRNKALAQVRAAEVWTSIIAPVIRRYWYQWFVFESVFQLRSDQHSNRGGDHA